MSRKRQLKKERARLEELDRQIERLARQGADEALLELAQGRAGELGPAALEAWARAADRALRQTLAGADLPRVQRLLRWIGRGPRAQAPPAIGAIQALAEVVVHLAEGRLAEARAGLEALGPASPPRLAAALADLCSPVGSETPGTQAVRQLQSALDALREGGAPARPGKVPGLQQTLAAVTALRAALPADAAASRLLDAIDDALRLVAELAGVERELRRWKGAAGLVPLFLDRTRALARHLLPVLREAPPPAALLRPLHHAVRRRWRTLLELVAEREGTAAWADLHAAAPALFSLDLEVCDGAERIRTRAAVRELHEAGKLRQLAGLLGSLSAGEKVPERRARLWSLELWAWEKAAQPDGEADDEPAFVSEAPQHAALVRLGRMAGEIAAVFPSEQRAEVARFLRARLIDFCERLFFCGHAIETASALLQHLPDDAALLVVALAGAVCSRNHRARARFEARIAGRGVARYADREALLRLVRQIAEEEAESIVRILAPLSPLLGEEIWPEAEDVVLRSFTEFVCASLEWDFDGMGLQSLLEELEVYRAVLGQRPGFAALEAALACVRPDPRRPKAIGELLDRSPELEAALTAMRVLAAADLLPGAPREVKKGLDAAREAAIARLDLRWRLWWPLWPELAIAASLRQRRRLESRLRLLLQDGGLGEEDRNALERALSALPGLIQRARHRNEAKKARRRNTAQTRFDFDLF